MNRKELLEVIKKIKEYNKYLLEDPERCKEFLIKTGVYDKHGNLTPPYRP